ncbi:MAG TPA: polysaccharide biosynthesis/export family protein [Candidatus Acidoferrum sp.]|jgi:polysaccharide export outer membrane protein|nr:polysaccharide biosynthesis/export family protein [Candidatus Acidoferrum sp.]
MLCKLIALAGACAGLAYSQARGATGEVTANLPAQKIGPRDLIAIQVYDSPEMTRTARVGADGYFRLPMLKQRIKAEGLMPVDLEVSLAQALEDEGLIIEPFVTVTVAEYSSRPISVLGAVKLPLTFQASSPVTLLEAITRAGGLAPENGPEILISKTQPGPNGEQTSLIQRVPVKALIDAADPDANIVLTGGEEIRVPEAGKVYVVGNVKKPGAFAVQDGAESSVLKMLAVAEGLAPFAGKQAFIYRREGNGAKNEIPIELSKIMDRKSPDTPLLPNDVLYIPDNRNKRIGMATLERLLMFGTTAGATALIYGH